jgi:hypothetical protein
MPLNEPAIALKKSQIQVTVFFLRRFAAEAGF